MLEKPPGHGGADSSTGTEKKGNQLAARAPGGGRDNPASGEQEKRSYAEVTWGASQGDGPGTWAYNCKMELSKRTAVILGIS